MIFSKKINQFILSILIISGASTVWGQNDGQQQVDTQVEVAKQESKPEAIDPRKLLEQMLGDDDKLKEIFASLTQGHAAKVARQQNELKRKTLDLLPDDSRKKVIVAQESYQDLVTSLNIEKCFLELCDQVQKELEQTNIDQEKVADFKQYLDKMHASLLSGSFMEVLFPGHLLINPNNDPMQALSMMMGGQTNVISSVKSFTSTDLKLLIEKAEDYQAAVGSGNNKESSLSTIIIWLRLAQEEKITELCNLCAESLAPLFKKASSNLQVAIQVLADLIVKAAGQTEGVAEESVVLKKGAKLWLDEFKKYKETIHSFLSMYQSSQLDMSFIVKALSRTHEICEPIFWHARENKEGISVLSYKKKNEKTGEIKTVTLLNLTNALDGTLRIAIAASSFANDQGKTAEQAVQDCLLQNGALSRFANPLNQWEYKVSKLAASSLLLVNPTVHSDRMPPLKQFLIRMILVWVSYQSYESYKRGKCAYVEGHCSPTYYPLRAVCLEALKSCQAFLTGKVYRAVAGNADPVLLEKIETYTLGLIKPDLISELSDILFQIIFQRQYSDDAYFQNYGKMSSIVGFDNEELFKYDYWFRLAMQRRLKRGGQKHDYHDYAANISEYAKFRLVTYAGKNIGSFCGKEIAGLFGNVIENWTLSAMQWLSGDQSSQELFEEKMGRDLKQLKMIVVHLFKSNTPERDMIVSYMKNWGFFKQNGYTDDFLKDLRSTNYAILAVVMSYFVNCQFLTHVQSSQFLNNYYNNPHKLDQILEAMFVAVKDNMTRATGGIVGGIIGGNIAQIILSKHIPIYHDAIDFVESLTSIKIG